MLTFRPRAAALALPLVLAAAATAHAAETWLPPRPVEPPIPQESVYGDTTQAVDTDGTLIVLVQRYHSGFATYLYHVYAKPPGGAFVKTKMSDDYSFRADLALDPRGGVAVAWKVGTQLKIRRRPPGGDFGPAEVIETGITGYDVEMDIGPDGRETFAFTQQYANAADDQHSRLLVQTRPGPGAPLGGSHIVSPNDLDTENGYVRTFDLTVGPSGAAALAFLFEAGYPAKSDPTLYVARRGAAAAAFSGPQEVVPATDDPEREQVELDAAGRATLVFKTSTAGAGTRARVADAPADTGPFGTPIPLSTANNDPVHNYVDLDVAPDGSAVIGFGGGGRPDQWVTRRGPSPADPSQPPLGFLGAQRIDGGFPGPEPPEVTLADDGAAYAVVRSGAQDEDIDGWRSASVGEPFVRTRLADDEVVGNGGELGITSIAGAAAIFYKDDETTLKVAPFDGAPPTATLTGPGSLPTSVAGEFALSATDYWGPVTTSIAHDDGGNGTPHAYVTTGTHTATATVIDAAGFTVTAQADTSVADPLPPAPIQGPDGGGPVGPAGPGTTPLRARDVIALPSAKRCVSRRRFRIRLFEPRGVELASAVVKVNGKPVKVLAGARLSALVDLRGLPKGRVRVRIAVTTSSGSKLVSRRTYRTCATKRQRPRR